MLNKNNETIYEWSNGKTTQEIETKIQELRMAIDISKMIIVPGYTKEMQQHIIQCNEEAIAYLSLQLIMKKFTTSEEV